MVCEIIADTAGNGSQRPISWWIDYLKWYGRACCDMFSETYSPDSGVQVSLFFNASAT